MHLQYYMCLLKKNPRIGGSAELKLVLFKPGTSVSSHIPKICTLGELFLNYLSLRAGVCDCALQGKVSCLELGPTLSPELPGYTPATLDPELE